MNSNISDDIQCFTNYEPRFERGSSMHSLIVAGRAEADYTLDLTKSKRQVETGNNKHIGWRTEIYEALASRKIIPMASKAGYVDYKVIMYGEDHSRLG